MAKVGMDKTGADTDRRKVTAAEAAKQGFVGTAHKDGSTEKLGTRDLTPEEVAIVEEANAMVREAYAKLQTVFTSAMPVGMVQWIPIEKVQANDYNPNSVALHEMKLLHTSISEDGYTMPCVTIYDEEIGKWVIVDGFHRYTTMRRYPDISDVTGGYLPVAVIDKPPADRIASTVRHNRARGKHSVAGMGKLVFDMLEQGESDETICNKLGLEAEELSRLKHITGFSKLFKDKQYSQVSMGAAAMRDRAAWAREHPEDLPLPEGV